jgi:AefR-like transcriptional repressor, C-terminal domain
MEQRAIAAWTVGARADCRSEARELGVPSGVGSSIWKRFRRSDVVDQEEPRVIAGDPRTARAAVMAELARVLCDVEAEVTSLEVALSRAKLSSLDVASLFGNARTLILAMVSQLADAMSAPLCEDATGNDWRQRLAAFSRRAREVFRSPHWRGLHRIAVTEATRRTGLASELHAVGLGQVTARLAAFLGRVQTDGLLVKGDPQVLASQLLAPLHADLALTHASRPNDLLGNAVASVAQVLDVIEVFCHGVGRRA